MPWVDLHSATDYASIFYTTNTFCYNVSAFDPEKPTIVLLHPVFLDSTWLDLQMGDPRLNKEYNMIAFDMRSCGQSTCRPSGQHDSWVDAADLAFCFQVHVSRTLGRGHWLIILHFFQKLYLPPSHILALEGTSIYCALRFAALCALCRYLPWKHLLTSLLDFRNYARVLRWSTFLRLSSDLFIFFFFQ